MRLDFVNSSNVVKLSIGNNSGYGMRLYSSGSSFDFIVPTIDSVANIATASSTFNVPFTTGYDFKINKGTSGSMFRVLSKNVSGSQRTRVFLGNDFTDLNSAMLTIFPDSSSDEGIFISHTSTNGTVFRTQETQGGNMGVIMRANGKMSLGLPITGAAWLALAAGDNSTSQILFNTTSSIATTSGGFGFNGSDYFGNDSSTVRRFIRSVGSASLGTSAIPKIDSSGFAVASGITDNGSIINFPGTESVLFGNGLSITGSKNLTMGGGATYTGGVRTTLGSISASSSLSVANHSPFVEFTGSTSGRTETLPTAASIGGTVFGHFNRATVPVTVATTSSQNLNYGTGTVTSIVINPGDFLFNIANASSAWDTYLVQYIYTPDRGGTGITSYAVGDLLYASGTTTLSKLAGVATGNVLISGGVTTAPSWGKVGLTTHVSGTLGRANGGTGQTSAPIKFTYTTDVNNGTTVETDLYSDTLAAGQFGTNGDIIEAQYGGIFTSVATSTQQLKAYFGGTLIFDSGALSIGLATNAWEIFVTIIRVSSSVVRASITLTTSFASLSAYTSYTEVTGLTLANTQVLKITGTAGGVSGGSNQITAKEGYVEYKPVT